MSHHFRTPREILPRIRPEGSPTVASPLLFLVSTPLPKLQTCLFVMVGSACLAKRRYCPRQDTLARMMHRRRETINRALADLKRQGLIQVKRRGKKLSNVYLLARRIWRALTGQDPPYFRDRQLHMRFNAGIARGSSPPQAILDALKDPGG